MSRQSNTLNVRSEVVADILGEAGRLWRSEFDGADLLLFNRFLPAGSDFVMIRDGRGWIAFCTGKPGVGYPAKIVSAADAEREVVTRLQRRNPDEVRTSAGWSILKSRPRLATEWHPGITT